jgi:hypothetical protein
LRLDGNEIIVWKRSGWMKKSDYLLVFELSSYLNIEEGQCFDFGRPPSKEIFGYTCTMKLREPGGWRKAAIASRVGALRPSPWLKS